MVSEEDKPSQTAQENQDDLIDIIRQVLSEVLKKNDEFSSLNQNVFDLKAQISKLMTGLAGQRKELGELKEGFSSLKEAVRDIQSNLSKDGIGNLPTPLALYECLRAIQSSTETFGNRVVEMDRFMRATREEIGKLKQSQAVLLPQVDNTPPGAYSTLTAKYNHKEDQHDMAVSPWHSRGNYYPRMG